MLIGAHVPNGDPLEEAAGRDAQVAQIFLSNPKGWKVPATRHDADALRAAEVPVYVHAPYLVNIASGNNRVRHPSRKMLQETCDAAANIGAAAVVVHGGYCEPDEDPEHGITRWWKALDELETTVPLLIENTAGGDNAVCRRFDRLSDLWDMITDMDMPVGFCLDTCHAHAAGEPLDGIIERVVDVVGRIDLVHVNDSRDQPGSGRDRHANLGRGHIDPQLLVDVVRAADAPAVVETPGGAAAQAADISWLRERL